MEEDGNSLELFKFLQPDLLTINQLIFVLKSVSRYYFNFRCFSCVGIVLNFVGYVVLFSSKRIQRSIWKDIVGCMAF